MLKPQSMFILWNRQGEFFHDLAPLDEALVAPRVGRGLAVADYDDDGDQDIAIVRLGEPPALLRNDMQAGHWVKLRLRSKGPDGDLNGFGDGAAPLGGWRIVSVPEQPDAARRPRGGGYHRRRRGEVAGWRDGQLGSAQGRHAVGAVRGRGGGEGRQRRSRADRRP